MVTAPRPDTRSGATTDRTGPNRSRGDQLALTGLALALWAAVVAVGRTWGLHLHERGQKIILYTPPILGGYRDGPPGLLWLPALVALAIVALAPWGVRRLGWRGLLVGATLAAAAWGASLAALDGAEGFTRGIEWRNYAPIVADVADDPGGFLTTFVDDLPDYDVQVRGHPPGFVLLAAGLHRVGLEGPGWAAGVVLAVGLSGITAVLVAVRALAGEAVARRSAPFVVLVPAALWVWTSVDALYVGVTAWSVALVVLAMSSPGRRSDLLAIGGGVLAGVGLLLSYGLVLVACIPLSVALGHRWAGQAERPDGDGAVTWRPVVVALGAAAVVVLAFVPLGFWYPAGLLATKHEYDTLDLDRPYSYFVVNNLSAWALSIGPAIAVALTRLRERRAWLLVGGGLAAVTIANLSGLSEGEVERIWLPFTVWVLVAGAALGGGGWRTRGWLAVQAATALVLTTTIQPNW